jgi:sulfite exporter TauE/SafE
MNPLLLPALSMGLFGGIHCVTMCGSASSVLCAQRRQFTLAFNLGRALGYTALGAAAGALGAWTVGHGIDGVRFSFRALAATTMLMVGLHLAGLPSFIGVFERAGAPIWRRVAPITRRLLPIRSPGPAFAAGVMWSLMPCGLLYAALAMSASAYSAFEGATTMAAFALGTMPIMVGLGAFAAQMLRRYRRLAGVIVLAFGAWSTIGVAAQAGIIPMRTCSHH